MNGTIKIGEYSVASRLSRLSPNLTSRLTPGTIFSSYEVYEALPRGIAVPFRKNDPEEREASIIISFGPSFSAHP